MSEKVLCVDDDSNVLAGYRRQLRKHFAIDTAEGGAQGLLAIEKSGPYAVIVADMNMPGMDGVQFLGRVRHVCPDTVRMMLTGNADQHTAMAAVNEGHIFRFLTKPCPVETLAQALTAGIEQYRLITAEKEILEKTLRGSIEVLTEVLALVNPVAFGRGKRVQDLVRRLAAEMKIDKAWQVEVAAMMSQLGCMAVPQAVLDKVYSGTAVSNTDAQLFKTHTRLGHDLIAHIPRLEEVAAAIALQECRYDGVDAPPQTPKGAALPCGARLLKAALDFDSTATSEPLPSRALERLRGRAGWYDPAILDALERILRTEASAQTKAVALSELQPDMLLMEDICSDAGLLLVGKGQRITPTMLKWLGNYANRCVIRQPICVQLLSRHQLN